MKLHELTATRAPSGGAPPDRPGGMAPAGARPPGRATRARRPGPAVGSAQALKAARCRCRDVSRSAGSTTFCGGDCRREPEALWRRSLKTARLSTRRR